jgi:hypothetical protein
MNFCRNLILAAVVLCTANQSSAWAEGAKVEPDKENVVASRLEGTWRPHAALTERLTGQHVVAGGESPYGELAFKNDPSLAEQLPEKYVKALAERNARIYMAGTMLFRGKELPFYLINVSGNPHVLFFLEQDGDRFGNGESFNVALAPAEERRNDLLFVGGDFNNEPFKAFERVRDTGDGSK